MTTTAATASADNTDAAAPKPLTDLAQKREAYWRDGFLICAGLFSADEARSWQQEANRLLSSEFVDENNIRTPFRMNSGDYPERIDPVLDISPMFAQIAHDTRITTILRALLEDEPLLFKDKLIFKLPGVDGYTMHQDQAWWQLCPPDDILSVSIAIDSANADNGGIALYRRYHDQMTTPAGEMRNYKPDEIAAIDLSRQVIPTTQPGDVLFFHSLTPHDSGKNTSPNARRSLYLSYSAARSGDLHARYYEQYKAREASKASETSEKYFR